MSKIKICGLTRSEDIITANHLGLDYIGFVFAKSKRQVTPDKAKALRGILSPHIQAVGVFVNHPVAEILDLVHSDTIQAIQLHGQEEETTIAQLKAQLPTTPIMKAISVTCAEDILRWESSRADYLLLDNGAGGTGTPFDWGILPTIHGLSKPYFIAGGLNPDNVSEVLPHHPYGVDVSGGVETDGTKDPIKMQAFTEKVREYL